MSIAAQIAQAARTEVESPYGSGLRWRIQKVNSADVIKAGVATLRMNMPSIEQPEDDDPTAKMKAQARMGDREIEQGRKLVGGVVCAGVTEVSNGGSAWEPIKIVMTEAERDKAGGLDANVLALSDLPAGVEDALFVAITNLHGNAAEAAERLARFRGAT